MTGPDGPDGGHRRLAHAGDTGVRVPPARRRRVASGLAAYAFLATMLGTTLPTPLYPLCRDRLGLSDLMMTVIFAVYAAGMVAAPMPAGSWSDQLVFRGDACYQR